MSESDYTATHQDRVNLLIHLVAVPLFMAGTLWIFRSAGQVDIYGMAEGFAVIAVSMASQAIGHRRERNPPHPSNGPRDFISRIFIEQFVKFPRFVLSGHWWRNFNAHP